MSESMNWDQREITLWILLPILELPNMLLLDFNAGVF